MVIGRIHNPWKIRLNFRSRSRYLLLKLYKVERYSTSLHKLHRHDLNLAKSKDLDSICPVPFTFSKSRSTF